MSFGLDGVDVILDVLKSSELFFFVKQLVLSLGDIVHGLLDLFFCLVLVHIEHISFVECDVSLSGFIVSSLSRESWKRIHQLNIDVQIDLRSWELVTFDIKLGFLGFISEELGVPSNVELNMAQILVGVRADDLKETNFWHKLSFLDVVFTTCLHLKDVIDISLTRADIEWYSLGVEGRLSSAPSDSDVLSFSQVLKQNIKVMKTNRYNLLGQKHS